MHTICKETLDELESRCPSLKRPFENTAFAALTLNLGPVVCTTPHKDMQNFAKGLCSVTSFGNYNPNKGGHLILWDLGIVIEFPPYSTILIPSAIIEHSNTCVQDGETRQSITQYISSGLLAWRANGFQQVQAAKKNNRVPDKWWTQEGHIFSNVNELVGKSGEDGGQVKA